MPNTPCAIGKGMILCAAHGVPEAEKTAFCEGMAAAGRLDRLADTRRRDRRQQERLLWTAALSGAGLFIILLM